MKISFFPLFFIFPVPYFAQCPPNQYYQPDLRVCLWPIPDAETFWSANHYCQSWGGSLLSIHNSFQNTLLARAQQNFTNGVGWLGANRQTNEWIWMDGTPFDYKNIKSSAGTGDCLYLDSSDQFWKIKDCSESMPYLCVTPVLTSSTTTTTPSTTSYKRNCLAPANQPLYNCLKGWQYFQETGFYYLITFDLTFDEGEAYCVNLGGHLASIHSDAENQFIAQMCCRSACSFHGQSGMAAIYLTGGAGFDGNLNWTDGTTFDYQNDYCYSYPDPSIILVHNHGGGGDCLCGERIGIWGIANTTSNWRPPYAVCKARVQ